MEYERRATVVASFRAGKKPAEVMSWFGFKRTMVMDMWRKWKSCDNKDEFTAERQAHKRRSSAVRTDEFVNAVKDTVDNDGGQSYAKIAADMGCPKGLRVSAEVYQEVLRDVVKPWMDRIANGRPYVFQQDSAPAHKARTTQAWLLNNVPHHWSPDL